MLLKNSFFAVILAFLVACGNSDILYESASDLGNNETVKLHKVKILEESKNKLTVTFTYTYENEVPEGEIKVYVLPDHGYWRTKEVRIQRGKHTATAEIGLSDSNMKADKINKSKTTKLRFIFDRYQPGKYIGNVWRQDIEYEKTWEK